MIVTITKSIPPMKIVFLEPSFEESRIPTGNVKVDTTTIKGKIA